MKIQALCISALAKLKNIAIVNVSVFIVVAPANVTVAPNSPTALAQVRRKAATIPFFESGNNTLVKA